MSPLRAATTGATAASASFSSAIGTLNLAIHVRAPANPINRCNSAGGKTRHAARTPHPRSTPSFPRRGNTAMDIEMDIGTEFRDVDYAAAYPPGYELHYWHLARSDIVKRLVRSACQKGDTILEIGAGRGHYVRVLRADGFDVFGCDLAVGSVHEEVQAFIFRGRDFADLDVTLRERVTAILLLDVLEHIEHPSDIID